MVPLFGPHGVWLAHFSKHLHALALTVICGAATSLVAGPTVTNPSFELNAPPLNSPGYVSGNTTINGWSTNNSARVGLNPLANAASPFADNGTVPNGSRVAFVQSVNGVTTSLSTNIVGLSVGTNYRVQFRANRSLSYDMPYGTVQIGSDPEIPFKADTYNTITVLFKAKESTVPLVIRNTSASSEDAVLLVDHFTIEAGKIIMITSAADSGPGTLRAALATAEGTPDFNVITFGAWLSGSTANLASEIVVNDPNGVVIDTLGLPMGFALKGNGTSNRIFALGAGSILGARNLAIYDGAVAGADGGGLQNAGTLFLTQCSIYSCDATAGTGGAIHNKDSGILSLQQCAITGNTASDEGGGVCNIGGCFSALACTFQGNNADKGGGLANLTDGRTILTHCTFAGNIASGSGGGVESEGPLTLENSIIANNTSGAPAGGTDVFNTASQLIRKGANLIEMYLDDAGGTSIGPASITADPQLGSLADNGGPIPAISPTTPTMALLSTSPARNAAITSTTVEDQRGLPISGAADIGAYEVQSGGSFVLSAANYAGFEGGVAEVTIQRGANVTGVATVRLTTAITTGAGAAGINDFTPRPNNTASDVIFLDGESVKTVAIPLTLDSLGEADETFTVTLGSPSSGASVGSSPVSASITIKNSIVVNSELDGPVDMPSSGTFVTLREALRDAKELTGVNAIAFSPVLAGKTIILNSELVLNDTDAVTIDATSIGGITISGSNLYRIFVVNSGNTLNLRRLTLTHGGGNDASSNGQLPSGVGGAILVNNGTLAASQCAFVGNHSSVHGGAITNLDGSVTVTQSTFSGNQSSDGGAIRTSSPFGDSLRKTSLILCTFSGNTASSRGGALMNVGGSLELLHCTVANNTGSSDVSGHLGGGIDTYGSTTQVTTTVTNSIVSDNINGDVITENSGGPSNYVSGGHNLIGSGSGSSAFLSSLGDILSDTPDLLPLADNGGPTQTRALNPTSPALNVAFGSTITQDQRGRSMAGVPDIGAYEEQQGGTFGFDASSYRTIEGRPANITIKRMDGFLGTATVRVVTVTGTASSTDFTLRTNIAASDVTFLQGEVSKEISIATKDDVIAEGSGETFTVQLMSPSSTLVAKVGTPAAATVTIADPILVTNINDAGAGSLRAALDAAKATTGADVIRFATALSGKTISLGSAIEMPPGAEVMIDATLLPLGLTIDGGPDSNRRILQADSCPITLRGLNLTGGDAPNGEFGGAIRISGYATVEGTLLTLERCTFFNNTASRGGAISADTGGNVKATQCTFYGNLSTSLGGAIYAEGKLELVHCALTNNTGNSGAGVQMAPGGALTMRYSICYGNNNGADLRVDNTLDPDFELEGPNVIGVSIGGGIPTGGSVVSDNPFLLPLANNGGGTLTCAIGDGASSARNAGMGSTYTTDQRGFPIAGDPDLGAFESQAGGAFVFAAPSFSGAEGGQVLLQVNRVGAMEGTATVKITTTAGTATAGVDYTSVSQVLTFNPGDQSQSVLVNLAAGNGLEATEFFTATLSQPTGAKLGPVTTVKVAIVDEAYLPGGSDTENPTAPVITTPAASALVTPVNGLIPVTGTVADNRAVLWVTASLNSAPVVPLPLSAAGTASTSFSATLSGYVAGTNTLTVTVMDYAGKMASTVRTFRCPSPLVVNVDGNGSVTAGFWPSSFRELSKPYTITATAGTGYLFAGWSILQGATGPAQIGLTTAALENPTITFVHREGLQLRARFVPNPYSVNVVGTFNGGVVASLTAIGGTTRSSISTEGYATFTVQPTGGFSGSLKLDGLTLPVAGVFDYTGAARFGTSRARTLSVSRAAASKPDLQVSLNFVSAVLASKIVGTVSQVEGTHVVAVSEVGADRASYSTTNPVPDLGYLVPDVLYTVQFLPDSAGQQPSGYAQSDYPLGCGYGSLKVTKAGMVSVTGMLPDGTIITSGTTLSQARAFRVFSHLYNMKGVLTGTATFSNNYSDVDVDAFNPLGVPFNTIWVRPTQDVQHYPLGWPDGLSIDMAAAKYTVPSGRSVMENDLVNFPMQDLSPGDLDGNAKITFSDGIFPDIVKTIGISDADVVTNLPADNSFSVKIDRATGTFTGFFTQIDGSKPTFKGSIKNKSAGTGQGYFMTPAPPVKDYTGRSGSVVLEIQP